MNLAMRRAEPCGTCERCKFAAQVQEVLGFIDRRLMPELEAAAQEITDARWHGSSRALEAAHKKFRRLKGAWLEQREKVLTAETVNSMTCPNTATVIILRPAEMPEPRAVSVLPREYAQAALDLQRANELGADCIRCGARLDYNPPAPIGVCTGCFGKELRG